MTHTHETVKVEYASQTAKDVNVCQGTEILARPGRDSVRVGSLPGTEEEVDFDCLGAKDELSRHARV